MAKQQTASKKRTADNDINKAAKRRDRRADSGFEASPEVEVTTSTGGVAQAAPDTPYGALDGTRTLPAGPAPPGKPRPNFTGATRHHTEALAQRAIWIAVIAALPAEVAASAQQAAAPTSAPASSALAATSAQK